MSPWAGTRPSRWLHISNRSGTHEGSKAGKESETHSGYKHGGILHVTTTGGADKTSLDSHLVQVLFALNAVSVLHL